MVFYTIYITHRNNAIRKIFRESASSFIVNTFSFDTHSSGYPIYQPYYKYADSATTITPSATNSKIILSGSIVINCSDNYGYGQFVRSIGELKNQIILELKSKKVKYISKKLIFSPYFSLRFFILSSIDRIGIADQESISCT